VQYWLEAIWITLAASIIAYVIGSSAVGVLSGTAEYMFGFNEIIQFTLQPFLFTVALGILIISVAVFLSAIAVLRMKPKEILSSIE
jgi:ABC-type antimicrobial peptide transport system permease subunit